MISKSAILGLLLVFGFTAGQLVEVDDTELSKHTRKVNSTTTQSPIGGSDFGQSDFGPEDGGLEILGPKNPNVPGDTMSNDVSMETDGKKEEDKGKNNDKTTEDPWKQFYDPDSKNPFGQSFPAPEDVPKVPKQPTHHFPDPETERPFGGQGQSNGGFGVAEPQFPDQGSIGPNHGFGNVPTEKPAHGTFEPYPTDAPNQGQNVPNQGGFENYPTKRPTVEPYPESNENNQPQYPAQEPNYYPEPSNENPENPNYYPEPTNENPENPNYYPEPTNENPENPNYYPEPTNENPENPNYYPEPTNENYNPEKDKNFPQFGGIHHGEGNYHGLKKPHHKWGHGGSILGEILSDLKEKHYQKKQALWEKKHSRRRPHHSLLGRRHSPLLGGRSIFSRIRLIPDIVRTIEDDVKEVLVPKV